MSHEPRYIEQREPGAFGDVGGLEGQKIGSCDARAFERGNEMGVWLGGEGRECKKQVCHSWALGLGRDCHPMAEGDVLVMKMDLDVWKDGRLLMVGSTHLAADEYSSHNGPISTKIVIPYPKSFPVYQRGIK